MKYKVYEISANIHYFGYSLVAAESEEEARQIIADFKASDPDNVSNSYGYDDYIEEDDVIEDIYSDRKGIIKYGIFYTG